jgi:predicted RNase H-like HicB family nuclease
LTTDTLKIVVEPGEDRWCAYCPRWRNRALRPRPWGYTKAEALQHIREVLEMLVAEPTA